ncbi:MAG: arginase [Fimbriimonadaceae bacterium]|nr:arginase [Fimbriimonadaceae bacterium]
MIEVVGVPFDLCGRLPGSRLGPSALRLAGLFAALRSLGYVIEDRGDLVTPDVVPYVPPPDPDSRPDAIRFFAESIAALPNIKEAVVSILGRGSLPLVAGGDHSLSIGSVAGALATFGDDLAVLWVDAHADLNTPSSSPSLNMHGMSLAALLGLRAEDTPKRSEQWGRVLDLVGPAFVRPSRVAWFGLRDVDYGERRQIREMVGCLPVTMHDIDRRGLENRVAALDEWLRKAKARHLWISFDVDAMDPVLAPGTGTAVRGGLTYREAHLLAELLRERLDLKDCPYRLVGLDIVETNPTRDVHNETALTAVEWAASLFGKTILGDR